MGLDYSFVTVILKHQLNDLYEYVRKHMKKCILVIALAMTLTGCGGQLPVNVNDAAPGASGGEDIVQPSVAELGPNDFLLTYRSVGITADTDYGELLETLGAPEGFESNNRGLISGNSQYRRWSLSYPSYDQPDIRLLFFSKREFVDGEAVDGETYLAGVDLAAVETPRGLKAGDSLEKAIQLYGEPNFTESSQGQKLLTYSWSGLQLELAIDETNDRIASVFVDYNMTKADEEQGSVDEWEMENNEIEEPQISLSLEDTDAIKALVPQNWSVLQAFGELNLAKGDLNGDGIADIAAVIEEQEAGEEEAPPRSLLIAFGAEDGTYSLSVIAANVILKSDEGGVWGEPFDSLSIEDGSVLVRHYGGSNWRWHNEYRFGFQDGDWYLIGATQGSYYAAMATEDDADTQDYNFLTGDYYLKTTDDEGKVSTETGNRGKKPLVKLTEFETFDFNQL